MRKCFAMMAVVLLAGSAMDSLAKDTETFYPNVAAPRLGEALDDVPAGAVPQSYTRGTPDTLYFGYVDGGGFAIPGETWTFDHGAGSLEGWYGVDITEQSDTYFQHITDASWNADPFNVVDAPVIAGTGSAWVGAQGTESRDLCWDGGLGYGNDWCQRLLSPTQTYGGGNVAVSWKHFNDSEANFDYSLVYLQLLPSQDETLLKRYTDQIGLAANHPTDPPVGVTDNDVLSSSDFQGSTSYKIVFEFTSDGSWSDEDALYTTEYGPAGYDDVVIGGNSYNFDGGLQGWTAESCPGFGTFLGIAPLSDYIIEDPCQCELAGNILEMHRGTAATGDHPYGQHAFAVSPPVDVLNDVTPSTLPGSGQLAIFADWDQYSVMPRANGVFYRPGWFYSPFLCELTGAEGWSPRIGQDTFFFVGEDPVCVGNRNIGTAVDEPVPVDAEQVRFAFELYASCDAFGIPPENCSQVTNFTPITDNFRIGFTRVPQAPNITFELGLRFNDGFALGTLINDPTKPGRADVNRNTNFGNTQPIVLGDSIQVAGPVVTGASNRWEARLWFRVDRKGPLAGAAYNTWRNQVNAARSVNIEAGQFAFAWMDSAQLGTNAFRNKFTSYLREDEWAAFGRGAGPELSDATEIIQDNVLWPGTAISYFVSSRYLSGGGEFLLPDTTGAFFSEFEILPSWRDVGGGQLRYPCLLYVDAFNAGAQTFIQNAVDSLGLNFDRFDYLDATSNWKAPMARGGTPDANNGCTLPQLLGYRGIFVNTGTSNVTQLMWPEDYAMMSDWLTAVVCDAGTATRQGLVMNGDGIATAMEVNAPTLLARMGALQLDDWYADFAANEDACVRLETPITGGEKYGTSNSVANYDYDAYGNWCPQQFNFDVISAVNTGVGNRVYLDLDDFSETNYNQVANEKLPANGDNYRTVIDGVSWHHMAAPDPARCNSTEANISAAAFNELAAAIEWIYGVDYDLLNSLCEDPCAGGNLSDIEEGINVRGVTKLFQNSPNPFNPRTVLRFSLASSGPAEVAIFDVSGRKVRTLVNGALEAGSHEVIWDGTDDAGRPLSSGVYWSNLKANGYESNMKMVLLK